MLPLSTTTVDLTPSIVTSPSTFTNKIAVPTLATRSSSIFSISDSTTSTTTLNQQQRVTIKVVLGITSLLMGRLCRKRGAGFLWGLSNISMTICFISMLVLTYAAKSIGYVEKGLPPPTGIVIAALAIFTILGFPLAITYSVPYALISTHIEPLGLGQGLSMGVLNLEIVVPQIIVSLGSGPWDQLFGGGNSPTFAVAAVAALLSGLLALLAIPRTGTQKTRSRV
ncbi:hypothetical protein RYX36_021289 [Vicia faba]